MAYRANNIGPTSLLTDAEKIKLWEDHQACNRSHAETAVIAKVSSATISNWFNDLGQRGLINYTGQKRAKFEMKDKMEAVRLHVQESYSISEVAEVMNTSHQNIYKWVRDFGSLIPLVPTKATPEEQAAELMRGHDKILGVDDAEQPKARSPHLKREEKIAVLQRQLDEGLTNKEAANIAGVSVPSIVNWRRDLLSEIVAQEEPAPAAEIEPLPEEAIIKLPEPAPELRKFSMIRADGIKIEAELSFDEIKQLMAA